MATQSCSPVLLFNLDNTEFCIRQILEKALRANGTRIPQIDEWSKFEICDLLKSSNLASAVNLLLHAEQADIVGARKRRKAAEFARWASQHFALLATTRCTYAHDGQMISSLDVLQADLMLPDMRVVPVSRHQDKGGYIRELALHVDVAVDEQIHDLDDVVMHFHECKAIVLDQHWNRHRSSHSRVYCWEDIPHLLLPQR